MNDFLPAIERALDADDLATAAELATRALRAGSCAPIVFNLAAWQLEQNGAFDEAETVLQKALALTPNDPSLHLALGVVRRGQGRLKLAVEALDKAIALDPAYAAAWFERGATFERGGALADAAGDFRHTLVLDPRNPAAHAALAANLARSGDLGGATRHADQALRQEPGNITARNAKALVAIEEKRFDDAIAVLEPIVGSAEDTKDVLVSTRTLLGDSYEGAGRYDEAYQVYVSAQDLFHSANSARLGQDYRDALKAAEQIGDSLEAVDPGLWQVASSGAPIAATHIFLTGYPRSGTTLVENVLATLPGAVAIEERRTLGMIDRAYTETADGLTRFASLPETELDTLRADYWARATEAAGEPLGGKLFIDMDPFKGLRLPIIAKLFPSAKIVLMRRDPRDVVWSCFHTSFAFNPGTMAFASLESTARHYALTQKVIARSLATLPIDAHQLRYERLVREFDATTQELCAFLGVPWDEELRRFDRTAARRGVSTASTTQVRLGLYDGSGGWRRYADQLATVEPILRPWIEALGYADT